MCHQQSHGDIPSPDDEELDEYIAVPTGREDDQMSDEDSVRQSGNKQSGMPHGLLRRKAGIG